jgi:hypothetical protein
MTSKPMYVWDGANWTPVGPVVPQTPIAYQASAPVSPSTGDIWVDSDGDVGTFDRQLVRYRFVASGGETSLSGVDANGFTLAYVPGAEQVYLNGVLLVRTSDYTATDGTSITALSPALAANDVVEVFAYNSFNLANTYTKAEVDAQNGLVHIETQTASAVSAVNFNDVFSATYNNYLINIQATSAAQSNMSLRLRASGTDASAANYNTQRLNVDNATITAARATGQTAFEIATAVSSGTFVNNFILSNPFAAKNTFMNPFANARLLNTLDFSMWTGNHTLTTSYDGFSVLGSTSFSGTISVYGFKE